MKYTITAIALFFSMTVFSQGTQLLRQPTVSDKEIVFVYANDLWKTSVNGGNAIRLTSNEGYELNPHFSRDGKQIAFTAQYDGNYDVYVIPSEGGQPKRLTFHSAFDAVQGWTPDNKILFRSNREGRPTQTNKSLYILPSLHKLVIVLEQFSGQRLGEMVSMLVLCANLAHQHFLPSSPSSWLTLLQK